MGDAEGARTDTHPTAATLAWIADERVPPAARLTAAFAHLVMLRALGHLGEAERVAQAAAGLLERAETSAADERVALARLQLGVLRLLRGDLDTAARDLRAAHIVGLHSRSDAVARSAAGDLALIHALRGDLRAADRWLAAAEATPTDLGHGGEGRPPVGGVAARAFTALARLGLDEARTALRQLADIGPAEELWAFVLVAHAVLDLCRGDAVAGLAALDAAEGEHRALLSGGSIAHRLVLATRLDLLLAVGQGTRARVLVTASSDRSDTMTLRRARVARVTGAAGEAVPLADAVAWGAGSSVRSRTGGFVTASLARWQLADDEGPGGLRDEAHAALARAVELAAPAGLLQPFVYAPRDVLLAIADAGPSTARIRALLDRPPLVVARSVLPRRIAVVELSERERAVLAQLATTPSLDEVARRLFVSTNTVKTHVRQAYRKLGAHSREEALSIAYRQGLLAPP